LRKVWQTHTVYLGARGRNRRGFGFWGHLCTGVFSPISVNKVSSSLRSEQTEISVCCCRVSAFYAN